MSKLQSPACAGEGTPAEKSFVDRIDPAYRELHALRRLPGFLLLFAAASGAAALIYEVVWFQLLELYLGSSTVSLATLLVTFMAGTCAGSVIFPRIPTSSRHPLATYAAIELIAGALGLVTLLEIPLFGSVYTAWAGDGAAGFLLRGVIAAICLLPPTLLIGATLPALARAFESGSNRVTWLGGLYAANIAGAVVGCLAASFYLLRIFDVTVAVGAAAAINTAVAIAAFTVSRSPGIPTWQKREEPTVVENLPRTQVPYVVIAISGFAALGAETVWTRQLALLFGPSVYTFSIVLAVFLAGLGIGSGVGALLARMSAGPKLWLAALQLVNAAAIAWTAYSLSASLPYWPIDPSIGSNVWLTFQLDLARALWALLPPAVLWGASFPLAIAATASAEHDGAMAVARVYAANTLGAIAGALGATILVASSGTSGVEQLLIAASMASGLLLLFSIEVSLKTAAMGTAVALACGFLIWAVPPMSKELAAHGRYAATWVGKGDIIFAAEGLNASVAVSEFSGGARTFHVAGKIQASSVPRDMRLQRMLGHLTSLAASDPRSVLVIGCGAGVTAGAVAIDPRVEQVTIAEIEPLVPKAADEYFASSNFDVIRKPKVQTRIDDGRHYLMTSRVRYDAITADPLDPWVKGAANLYTREFLEVARERLNPGGVITLYVQLFETDKEAVRSLLATFFEVFPDGIIWGNTHEGKGYDMVLLGTHEALRLDLDAVEKRYAPLARSLADVGIPSLTDLFATYAGRGSDLASWLRGAAINRDRNLRLQYLAGLSLDRDDSAAIYRDILRYRRFPADLFVGDVNQLEKLREAFAKRGPSPA